VTMVSAPEDMARAACRESYVTRAVRAISRANSSASREGSISFMGSERYASEVSYAASTLYLERAPNNSKSTSFDP